VTAHINHSYVLNKPKQNNKDRVNSPTKHKIKNAQKKRICSGTESSLTQLLQFLVNTPTNRVILSDTTKSMGFIANIMRKYCTIQPNFRLIFKAYGDKMKTKMANVFGCSINPLCPSVLF
jgi:hypothetical protein